VYPDVRRDFIDHSSFTNLLISVPMCGKISTANSSPALTVTGGLRLTSTPAGVPVKMIVPACRVVPCDRKLMSLGMLKMRSLRHISKRVDDWESGCLGLTLYGSLVAFLHSGGHVAAKRRDWVSRSARQASDLPQSQGFEPFGANDVLTNRTCAVKAF
jgi:hypothetical protein